VTLGLLLWGAVIKEFKEFREFREFKEVVIEDTPIAKFTNFPNLSKILPQLVSRLAMM
jgi:hypothetical protein